MAALAVSVDGCKAVQAGAKCKEFWTYWPVCPVRCALMAPMSTTDSHTVAVALEGLQRATRDLALQAGHAPEVLANALLMASAIWTAAYLHALHGATAIDHVVDHSREFERLTRRHLLQSHVQH